MKGTDLNAIPKDSKGIPEARPYIEIYEKLCLLKDNPELRIRPNSVFLYYKYLLARNFDPETARINLREAYAEKNDDIAVPDWSVYRVKIPYALANDLFREARSTIRRIEEAGSDVRRMPGLSKEIKVKLLESLRYAVEAFDIYSSDTSGNRGDLIYGPPEVDDKVKDARLVMNIYLAYVDYFKETVARANGVSAESLIKVRKYLNRRKSDAKRIFDEVGYAEFVKQLADAKVWIEQEVDEQRPKGDPQ